MLKLKEAAEVIRKEVRIQAEITKYYLLTVDTLHAYYCDDGCAGFCCITANTLFDKAGLMDDELPPLALERAQTILGETEAQIDSALDWEDYMDTIDSVRPGGM